MRKGSRKQTGTVRFRKMNDSTWIGLVPGLLEGQTFYIRQRKNKTVHPEFGKVKVYYVLQVPDGSKRKRTLGEFRLLREAKEAVHDLTSKKKSLPVKKKQKHLPQKRRQQTALQKKTSQPPTQSGDILEQYHRFFRSADRTSDGRLLRGFRSVLSPARKRAVRSQLKKHHKALSQVLYGNPFFAMGGIHFSLGTANSGPAWNAESIPPYIKQGMGYVYFGFANREKYLHLPDVRQYLGLDSKKKAAKGQLIQIIEIKQNRLHEGTYLARMQKMEWFKALTPQEKKYQKAKAKAKAYYPFYFPISDLPIFIAQIREKHPHIAIALAKVYFGTEPGAASNCPDTGLIQEIARTTGIKVIKQGKKEVKKKINPTKAQIALINKWIGPLATYHTRPSPDFPKGKSYRFYQKVGIAFWRSTAKKVDGQIQVKALIGDDMGVGKTVQAIGAIQLAMFDKELPNPYPVLVISPSGPHSHWVKELNEWLPQASPLIVRGTDWKQIQSIMPRRNPVLITTYASATKYQNLLASIGFKFLVIDESHAIKNRGSSRSQALRRLAFGIPLTLLLSGTPEDNKLLDLWAQMYILDPHKFHDINKFEGEFHILKYNPKTKQMDSKLPHTTRLPGNKFLFQTYNIQGGGQYVIDPPVGRSSSLDCYMIRRLKSQIVDLPPKSRTYNEEPLSAKLKKMYEQFEKETAEEIFADRIEKWAIHVAQRTRLNLAAGIKPQAAFKEAMMHNSELEEKITEGGAGALPYFSKLRRKAAVLRIPMVVNWVRDFYQNRVSPSGSKGKKGDTLLIFAEHHKIINELVESLRKIVDKKGHHLRVESFTGKTNQKQRDKFERQLNSGMLDVLILNKAGNQGLNLQRANYVLFAERYWTPGQEQQAEDRAHRSGQKKNVFVYYFNIPPWTNSQGVYINPIDNRLNDIILRKRADVKAHIGNQSYATEKNIKSRLTAAMMDDVSRKFKAKMTNNKNKKDALRYALKQYHIKGVQV